MRFTKPALAIIFLLLPLPAFSQQAISAEDKLKTIIPFEVFDKNVSQLLDQTKSTLIQHLKGVSNKITPEIGERIANHLKDEMELIKPEMYQFFLAYHKERLTDEELGALYDFYRTPIGGQVARKMSDISIAIIPETQTYLRKFAPRLQMRLVQDPEILKALQK